MSRSNSKIQKILLAGASVGVLAVCISPPWASAQEPSQAPPPEAAKPQGEIATGPIIKKEARLVLVDAVVTDKKGNYIHDLKQDDFRVFEDDKEQSVTSFSLGSDPAAPNSAQKRYLVLFFDNSTMATPDQLSARSAATKFIDGNVNPDHLMAVVEFSGALRIVQNFTANADLLRAAARGVKTSSVASNIPTSSSALGSTPNLPGAALPGMPSISSSGSDYGARTMLLAIRTVAKNLRAIPGRKMLVLFSSGFPLTAERESELTATIDACNKANVAIYALDVRGLAAPGAGGSARNFSQRHLNLQPVQYRGARARNSSSQPLNRQFVHHRAGRSNSNGTPRLVLASFPDPQRPTGGGGPAQGGGGTGGTGGGRGGTGGTGGGTGGGAGGGRGGTGGTGGNPGGGRGTGTNPGAGGTRGTGGGVNRGTNPFNSNYYGNNPLNQPRTIVPTFPESTSTNQQILAALAEGTGGFTIFNTNDLLGGLQRIGSEQNEFYLLGYVPKESNEGSCHTLKVKLNNRGGLKVRSRSGYCNARPANILEGTPVEKQLELKAKDSSAGSIRAALQVPYFYTAPDVARVNVTMDLPPGTIHFDKDKGKYKANLNILGIAYKPDGTIGARFSDQVKLDLEKDDWKKLEKNPYHYSNQFDAASGSYNLTVVLSAGGDAFGKLESPLKIDSYDGKQFSMSAAVMTNDTAPVSEIASSADLDVALLEDRVPLVVKGMQITPLAENRFKRSDKVVVYLELYEPLLSSDNPPKVITGYKIFDSANKEVFFTGNVSTEEFIQKGNPVIPVGLKVPVKDLAPGKYRLTMLAIDAAGRVAPSREVGFDVTD